MNHADFYEIFQTTRLGMQNPDESDIFRGRRTAKSRRKGDRSMFSANRFLAKCVFSPKNGPVPGLCKPPDIDQENCKVPTQRGQVHVFGQPFLSKMCFLAEKWTSPRTLQTS